MVGRGDNNVGVCAAALNVVSGVRDARGRVAACWFAKYLVRAQHGQVFEHQMLVGLVGHHEEVLVRDDGTETFVGGTDKALARTQYIEELLGIVVFAEGPETASYAASHDDTIVVHNVFIKGDKDSAFSWNGKKRLLFRPTV